jgi:hypothetical protein
MSGERRAAEIQVHSEKAHTQGRTGTVSTMFSRVANIGLLLRVERIDVDADHTTLTGD